MAPAADPNDWTPALRRFGPAGPDVRVPIVPDEASGARLISGGRDWLDFANGCVLPLGYRHPALARVVAELGHLPGADGIAWPQHAALMRKLAEAVPGGMNRRVMLLDSGREAMAQAIALARNATGRQRVVYFDADAEPDWADVAVVIIHPFDPQLPAVRAACTRSGALLADDETLVGPGLAGRMFGMERAGTRPDIYVLGRGWAGGLPFGACVTGSSTLRWPGFNAGCSVASAAAALETIRLIEGGLLEKAEQLSLCLMERLKTIPVGTASGFGLVWTFALPGQLSARRVVEQCRESGLLLRLLSADSFGIRPPLVVTEAEIDRAVSILRQFLVRDGDSA